MSAIKSLNESWADHTFAEIEEFIKEHIELIEQLLNEQNE